MNASHGALEAMLGSALVDAGVAVVASDGKHSVSDVAPVHLPHLWSEVRSFIYRYTLRESCSQFDSLPLTSLTHLQCAAPNGSCVLNTTTVTEARYATLDALDTGESEVSATELRTKIVSREALMLAAGLPPAQVNFTRSDVESNPCAAINAKVISWALANAGAAALARYADPTRALKIVAGNDTFLSNVGPLWIDNPLKLVPSADGSSVVVHAPSSHTPVAYPIKEAAGFHYCKILSPGRAMEWIYTDSLSAKGGV